MWDIFKMVPISNFYFTITFTINIYASSNATMHGQLKKRQINVTSSTLIPITMSQTTRWGLANFRYVFLLY